VAAEEEKYHNLVHNTVQSYGKDFSIYRTKPLLGSTIIYLCFV